jgi:hypothetical protein
MLIQHRWFFNGKIIKIINGLTVIIWLDLGFGTWKKQLIRFNRLKVKGIPSQNEIDSSTKFLEENIKNKHAYFQVFKRKDYNNNGFDKYYAEIYMQPGDVPIQLKDLNKNFNNPYRIDGLINLNDVLVSQGLAEYFVFNKK